MTVMAGAVEAARLPRTHSPSLLCESRLRFTSARNLHAGAASTVLHHGVKLPRIIFKSSAAVNSLENRRGLRIQRSDPATFPPFGSRFGLSAGLYSRKQSSSFFSTAPQKKLSSSRVTVVAQAKKNDTVGAPERVLAALGYVLPLFDGIQYGRYFFLQYPAAEMALRPLYPLLSAYKSFPYSNFIAFFALYLLVVRNDGISRYVRFNAMQAVVLDVLLILPTLVERTFAPRGGVGFELLIIFYNTVFLFLVSCFLFGVVSCILGKVPRLPIVADAADAQV